MLATKNPARWLFAISLAAAITIFAGCTASGPRALLKGDAALRDGKLARAMQELKLAADLMPEEPRAWNLLGVAYHQAGHPQLAAQAYAQALKRDRSNLVAVAHFNFGCLLLEQGNPAAAVDELRSFTMITNSALGWVKLGEAQLRLRQFDAAERSFANALRLQDKSVQSIALNDLAVVCAQRNRTREAFQHLNNALRADPKFAPALLNTALLAQQSTTSRAYALQRFRDYLAVEPRPANWESVSVLARQLESELSPRPAPPKHDVVQAPPPAEKTNPPVVAAPPRVVPPVAANTLPKVAVAPPTNTPVVRATPPPQQTNIVVARVANPPATNAAPSAGPVTIVSVTPPPRVFAATSSVPIIKAVPTPPVTNVAPPLVTSPPIVVSDSAPEKSAKTGLLQRFNPFRSKPDRGTATETTRAVVAASPAEGALRSPVTAANKSFARYRYVNPAAPKSGNRAEAERAFAQGTRAQRAGNTNEALLDYQLAISADPSYLHAQYNYALLIQQAGDVKRSLAVWETVLAIEPDSINARYNFALALKQADFPHDAATELEKILEAKPTEARAHLTLANLSAQQLDDNRRARAHYMQVLELDPRNSQASAIRFWLAANP